MDQVVQFIGEVREDGFPLAFDNENLYLMAVLIFAALLLALLIFGYMYKNVL